MTLSSLHDAVGLCYATTGDYMAWITRWVLFLMQSYSKGWCCWKSILVAFGCFLALIFKNILFLFKTSDHGVAWSSEEWKFLGKKKPKQF